MKLFKIFSKASWQTSSTIICIQKKCCKTSWHYISKTKLYICAKLQIGFAFRSFSSNHYCKPMKTFAFEMCENAFVIFFSFHSIGKYTICKWKSPSHVKKWVCRKKNLSMEIEIEILDVHWQSYLICISAIGSKISIQVWKIFLTWNLNYRLEQRPSNVFLLLVKDECIDIFNYVK